MSEVQLIEISARALLRISRPDVNPGMPTPAPRGRYGFIPKWRMYEDFAAAALAALREAGFAIVPKEPTQAMKEAAAPWPKHWPKEGEAGFDPRMKAAVVIDQMVCSQHYRAMIAAASPAEDRAQDGKGAA